MPAIDRRLTRATRLGCLLAATCCACTAKSTRPQAVQGDPYALGSEPGAGATCRPESFTGPWLIDSGTATLSCDDGANVVLAAGGHIQVEAAEGGAKLTLVDGTCRYPLGKSGCTLVAPMGVPCKEGETSYSSREIKITQQSAEGLSLLYALEHPDPDDPRRKCLAATRATMIRAAKSPAACALEGRWEAATTPDGRPGRTAVVFADRRCTFEAAAHKTDGGCQRQGDTLTIVDDTAASRQSGCVAGQKASYTLTFSADCAAFTLEAKSEPCEGRQSTIEYLLFRRTPGI
jgi:hypothetical protein